MPATVFRLSLTFAFAVSLGLIAWAADRVSFDSDVSFFAGAGNLPSHWLLTAFVVGVVSRSRPIAPLAATLALCLAVAVYYAAISWAGDRPGVDLQRPALAWGAIALVAGPVFGLAGAVWLLGPARWRAVGVGLLCGGFAGEALFILWPLQNWRLDEPATVFATIELAFAALLPLFMLRKASDQATALLLMALFGLMAWAAIEWVGRFVDDVVRPY